MPSIFVSEGFWDQYVLCLINAYSQIFLFRFNLFQVEQELGTEIQPIPKVVDKKLYVAEYQVDTGVADDNPPTTKA